MDYFRPSLLLCTLRQEFGVVLFDEHVGISRLLLHIKAA
jgi:hypothetical protein